MTTKYTKLVKNTIIFTIGSFATKILSYLIVPLYTYLLSTEEYGRIDLFFTAGSLLISFFSLQIHQAMMRFLLGKEIQDEIGLSNCMAVFVFESATLLLFMPVYIYALNSVELGILFYFNLIFSSFNLIFSDYLLVVEKRALYAIKGVVVTIVLLSGNLIALILLGLGLRGYIYATVISQLVGALFLLLSGNYYKKISLKYMDLGAMKQMLRYCVPLIPNSLMWWIMSSGDKFIINYFLGNSANGIYSLAMKVPTIISMFYSYFIQAWIISAIEENNSEERKRFYEDVYKVTNAILLILVAGITLFAKPLFTTIMGDDFKTAWMYVPVLSLATAFSCQTTFFGVFYTVSKKTRQVFYTTLIGTIVNVVANFVLVQIIGLHGIAIGTFIGYAIVLLIRMRDTYVGMRLDLDIKRTTICLCVLFSQITITVLCGEISTWTVGIFSCFLIVALYLKEIRVFINQMLNKFKTTC